MIIPDAGAVGAIEWLATYAVHSTLLLGAAALLARRLPSDAWRETAWKAALVGGILTATTAGLAPGSAQWVLPGLTAPAADAAAPALPSSIADDDAAERAAPISDPSGDAGLAAAREAGDAGKASSGTELMSALPTPRRAAGWLVLAWAAVAAVLLARVARRNSRLRRLLVGRRVVREPAVLRVLAELQRGAGVWRPVRLTASRRCPTPLALGGGEICLPERLLADLDDDQRRGALAHELAHVARRDPAWQLGAAVLEAVLFFQPLNRLARRRMKEAAEHLCDDWAVRQTGSPIALARCLAEVAAWVGSSEPVPSGTLAMAEGGSPLLRRVERLLADGPRPPRDRPLLRAGLALGLVALVGAGAPAVSASVGAPVEGGETPLPPVTEPTAAPAAPSATQSPEPEPAPSAAEQERVIPHPSPATPLEGKWAWVPSEAESRGHRDYWVAWSIDRVLPARTRLVEDSHGWSTDEWSQTSLGRLLLGPSYRPPEREAGEARQSLIVLLHVRRPSASAGAVDRVAVRSAALGMDLRGQPIYWLGATPQEQSFDWLAANLDDLAEPRLQGTAVEAIALHESSARVVPFLEEVIRSRRPDAVREEAVEGLEWHPTEAAVRLLESVALADAQPERLREEAAEALGEVRSPAAEGALVRIVRSGVPVKVRAEAVEAMGGRGGASVKPELLRVALEDPSRHVQEEALEALAEAGGADAVPDLARLARTHPDPRMQEEALEALGEVDAEAALEVLEALLADPSSSDRLRKEALEVLARRRTPRALERIFQVAMSDRSPRIQREAVEEIAEFPAEDAAPLLERIVFEHPSSAVRREAVDGLEDLPGEVRIGLLDRIFQRSDDLGVLKEALDILEDLPDDVAVPRLRALAESHPRAEVRREAYHQLGDREGRRRKG